MPYYQQLAEFEQPTATPAAQPVPVASAAPNSDTAPWGQGPNWTCIAVIAGVVGLFWIMSGDSEMRRNEEGFEVYPQTEAQRTLLVATLPSQYRNDLVNELGARGLASGDYVLSEMGSRLQLRAHPKVIKDLGWVMKDKVNRMSQAASTVWAAASAGVAVPTKKFGSQQSVVGRFGKLFG